MPANWIDASSLSFNSLLLLERVQLSWWPSWSSLPHAELAIALSANPAVDWYLRHKCPELVSWLDAVIRAAGPGRDATTLTTRTIRAAEISVLASLQDVLVYALDPDIYDRLPFLRWDSTELTGLVDFSGKVVIDVGAGTGRLTWLAAEKAAAVYAVEPVNNLRDYLWQKIRDKQIRNVFPQDGLITRLPFQDRFADVTMGGHVYGDEPEVELKEMERVTRVGGMVILCPGNRDRDDAVHTYLVGQGYAWSRFEEPQDGIKRKYWKTVTG